MTDELNGRLAFSREELRRKTGLGFNAIDTAIRERRLHAIKVGRRVLIPAASVRQFLEGR